MVGSKQNRGRDQKGRRGVFLNCTFVGMVDKQNEQNKWAAHPDEEDNPIREIEGSAFD